MSSDEALMLEFQQGSREAFEEIFARYRQPLLGFFRRRLANKERAEDLAQETFLAVIRATARYEPRSLVRTYLYGIALNLLANERRRHARQPSEQIDEHHDLPAQSSADGAPETVLWVRQAVETLEARDREVLMLREYEQLSYTDIAQLLRMPLNTVRTRLFRARMALKDVLQPGLQPAADQNSTGDKAATGNKSSSGQRKENVPGVSTLGRSVNPGPTGSEA